jgi:methionine S-methyltransferase
MQTPGTIQARKFLAVCQESSFATIASFTQLLENLEDSHTQQHARKELEKIWEAGYSETLPYFSSLLHSCGSSYGSSKKLKLIIFPSVFSPEEWSVTFFEGLLRYSPAEFYDRTIIELGTGCGWIALALAFHFLPRSIVAVDINPRAILCGKINAYLNGLDAKGLPVCDHEGKSILERVTFKESDLLSCFTSKDPTSFQSTKFDRIIGCIPQVLAPELPVVEPLASISASPNVSHSDEVLYSLSNYYQYQGIVEDQFGLGLIARAVEEAIPLLRFNGRVIFNIGGRPGSEVLERMLQRRGLRVKRIWQTRVAQTSDTDISGLVTIERSTGHHFEFFLSERSPHTISAATAFAIQEAGMLIYHAVSVYEGQLVQPNSLKRIMDSLSNPLLKSIHRTLDLTEAVETVAEERYTFLANLLEQFCSLPYGPLTSYGPAEGHTELRKSLADYLYSYYLLPCTAQELVIAPNRRSLLQNVLQIFNPKCVVADATHRRLLAPSLTHHDLGTRLFEVPSDATIIEEVSVTTNPKLIITALSEHKHTDKSTIQRISTLAATLNALLVIDISEQFGLWSDPAYSGLMDWFASENLPPHVLIMCDLTKNNLYRDISLCFALTSSRELSALLVSAAELSYSRVAALPQLFFHQIVADLIRFQFLYAHDHTQPNQAKRNMRTTLHAAPTLIPAPYIQSAFSHHAISESGLNIQPDTLRLDYGENCLPPPYEIILSFAEVLCGTRHSNTQTITSDTNALTQHILELIEKRFLLSTSLYAKIAFGCGVASLFSALLRWCRSNQTIVYFPQGAYGHFRAALDFHNVTYKILKQKGFLTSADDLTEDFRNGLLYINAPIANPTGLHYSHQELKTLIKRAWSLNMTVALDVIFSGLLFDETISELDLSFISNTPQPYASSHSPQKLLILGGVAKEFAMAGARFAFLYGSDRELVAEIENLCTELPDSITISAMSTFYHRLNQREDIITNHLRNQRKVLKERAQRLSHVLTSCGWDVVNPDGGLFLTAKPTAFLKSERFKSADDVVLSLFTSCNIAINNASWTGIPNHCRFVLSVDSRIFEEALFQIGRFKSVSNK